MNSLAPEQYLHEERKACLELHSWHNRQVSQSTNLPS